MKEYIAKNFICYTVTVQQATFRTDLDLHQAGLGLSVQPDTVQHNYEVFWNIFFHNTVTNSAKAQTRDPVVREPP